MMVQYGICYFNFNNKTLANLKVRKALLMAIDREGLINNVLNGYGTAAKNICSKRNWNTGKMEKTLQNLFLHQHLDIILKKLKNY